MDRDKMLFQYSVGELQDNIRESVKEEIKDFYGLILEGTKSPRYISRLAACEVLGISEPTLNEKTKEGLFVSYRIGGKVVYNYHQLIEAMETRCKVSFHPKIKRHEKKSA